LDFFFVADFFVVDFFVVFLVAIFLLLSRVPCAFIFIGVKKFHQK